jgi:hypothetical protein
MADAAIHARIPVQTATAMVGRSIAATERPA